jgi:hypothetical protein
MALAFERATVDPRLSRRTKHSFNNQNDEEQNSSSDTADLTAQASETPIAVEVYALLPRASEKIARICAEMLTSAGHMTPSLAYVFLARGDRSSLIALAGAQTLPPAILLHRATTGTLEEARAVASRPHLDPLILSGLIDRDDAVIDHLIAESRTLTDAYRVVDHLLHRARKDQKLATLLLDRDDLPFHQRAKLFEKASPPQRAALMREAIEEHSSSPLYELTPKAPPHSLATAIEQQDRDGVLSALAASAGLSQSAPTLQPRLNQPDGAVAALTCLSLGLAKGEISQALRLIGVDPVKALRPGGAEDVLERLSGGSAKLLLDAMITPQQVKRDKATRDREPLSLTPSVIEMDAVA